MNNNFIGTGACRQGRGGTAAGCACKQKRRGNRCGRGCAACKQGRRPLQAGLRPAFEPHALRYAVLRGEFNVGSMCVWFGFFCRDYCYIG